VTGTDFEDVDLDRLADYVSGALDGTPDATAVANLVATDPRWTRAHAALVTADALVRADLAALASGPEPMPDDVAARLDAVLAAEPPLTGAAPTDGGPPLSVLPGGRAGAAPKPHRRRWGTVVGVAAAVVVALGIGTVSLAPHLRESSRSTAGNEGLRDTGKGAPPAAAPSYALRAPNTPGLSASGSNYTAESLAGLGGPTAAAEGGDKANTNRPNAMEAPASQPAMLPAAVPEQLRPLLQPEARDRCLKAILKEYGGTATLMDYARYQGSPALVVVLDGAHGVAGRRWVVVVGPKCGTGGAIADERYSAQIK
jgi:hypothetical protein